MSDVKIQQSGISGTTTPSMDTYYDPRAVFKKHMQEARAQVETHNLPEPVGVFGSGLRAGVEMTLDVLKMHGYKLIDPEGNVVNADDQPSLAFGIWHVPFSEEPTL